MVANALLDTASESTTGNTCDTIWYIYTCKTRTINKSAISYISYRITNSNARQSRTVGECIIANDGHGIRNDNARQTQTILKCLTADTGHLITYYDFLDTF